MDLLDEAVERATVEIKKRVAEQEANGSEVFLKDEASQKKAAETLGIAAVRYFDMKSNRTSSYVFNYDKMLDNQGNTALYLFYAYARICSIQRKCGFELASVPAGELRIEAPQERALALRLLQFPDVINAIFGDLMPHRLTDYLWETCSLFTSFYSNCRVEGTPEQNSRLLLIEATRKVLNKSFFLLGFEPLDRI